MLTYSLREIKDHLRIYRYFPEGKSSPGLVSIDQTSGIITILHLSDQDTSKIYAFKLISRLRKFYESGQYIDEGMIAWY